jgi:hypothetical protein
MGTADKGAGECEPRAGRRGQPEEAQEPGGALSQGHSRNLFTQLRYKRMELDFSASRRHTTDQERPQHDCSSTFPAYSGTMNIFHCAFPLAVDLPHRAILRSLAFAQASDISHPKEQSPRIVFYHRPQEPTAPALTVKETDPCANARPSRTERALRSRVWGIGEEIFLPSPPTRREATRLFEAG